MTRLARRTTTAECEDCGPKLVAVSSVSISLLGRLATVSWLCPACFVVRTADISFGFAHRLAAGGATYSQASTWGDQ